VLRASVAERALVMFSIPRASRLFGDEDMSRHTPRHGIGTPARFRVTFAKQVMGVRFPIASVEVRRARDAGRSLASLLRLHEAAPDRPFVGDPLR